MTGTDADEADAGPSAALEDCLSEIMKDRLRREAQRAAAAKVRHATAAAEAYADCVMRVLFPDAT